MPLDRSRVAGGQRIDPRAGRPAGTSLDGRPWRSRRPQPCRPLCQVPGPPKGRRVAMLAMPDAGEVLPQLKGATMRARRGRLDCFAGVPRLHGPVEAESLVLSLSRSIMLQLTDHLPCNLKVATHFLARLVAP
jgi:hypothetical protein